MTVRSGDARAGGDVPTVFIVDDDPAVRAVVARAADSVSLGVEVCGDGKAALAAIDPARGGCIVLDVRLPDGNGLDLLAALRARGVLLPAVILTGYASVTMAVEALRAGVFDFFEKPVGSQALVERLQAAIAVDLARRAGSHRVAEFTARMGRLTPREREVLAMVVEGSSSRQIAAALALGRKTVETHRANLMAKTGVSSLAELIRLGLLVDIERAGLADPSPAADATPPQRGMRR
jgi:FixJ family two-component response regulator